MAVPEKSTAEGVLLHPRIGQHLDESATIHGRRRKHLIVDLGVCAVDIRLALLAFRGTLLSVSLSDRLATLVGSATTEHLCVRIRGGEGRQQ
ncbi:hypothetical protein [Gordonia westfalica]|uniref:hypothetical protein n=1 Tax=Gordonia westfalica TaxID=158898 RepID=UPI000942AD52|nr:hypothetical protein [Gordonia westfalica]